MIGIYITLGFALGIITTVGVLAGIALKIQK